MVEHVVDAIADRPAGVDEKQRRLEVEPQVVDGRRNPQIGIEQVAVHLGGVLVDLGVQKRHVGELLPYVEEDIEDRAAVGGGAIGGRGNQ